MLIESALSDREILMAFREHQYWGMASCIDLTDCNPDKIRDIGEIRRFVIELCRFLKVKTYGDPQVVHFGEDPRVNGFSMVQLIETSLISGHFANHDNSAFLDIFSCKEYPPKAAAYFCSTYFEAKSYRVSIVYRGGLR